MNNTNQKIKELQKQLNDYQKQLDELKSKSEKPETKYRERANTGDTYSTLDDTGNVCNLKEYRDKVDDWDFLTGNYFLTREEAEEYKEYLQALGEIKNYIRDNGLWFKPD